MRCQICNKETNSYRKDPDGKYVSICGQCRSAIYEANRRYEDIEDEDFKILKQTAKDFERESKDGGVLHKKL